LMDSESVVFVTTDVFFGRAPANAVVDQSVRLTGVRCHRS
jgi:hypothetical protein